MELQQKTISREQLYQEWSRELQNHPIIYISGGAGVGKTYCLREWAQRQKQKVWYVRADEPALLETIQEHIAQGDAVVQIDEVQRLQDAFVKQGLVRLLQQTNASFLLAGRGIQPRFLKSLFLSGKMKLYEQDALMFCEQDTAALFREFGASAAQVRAIYKETQGWPLAVRGMRTYLEQGKKVSPEMFAYVRQDMIDYLNAEVFTYWSKDIQDMMLSISLVPSFTPGLAAAAVQKEEIQELLRDMEDTTSFLKWETDGTYSCNPSFLGEYLSHKREMVWTQEQSNAVRVRIGEYYEKEKAYDAAVRMYLQAGDLERMIPVLERVSLIHPGKLDYYALEDAFAAVPKARAMQSPELMAGLSMLHSLCYRAKESEEWAKHIYELEKSLPAADPRRKACVRCRAYLDIALPHRGSGNTKQVLLGTARLCSTELFSMPEFSLTGNMPSVLSGGKDFCDWTLHDKSIYKILKKPIEVVLGPRMAGFADISLGESTFERSTTEQFVEPLVWLNSGLLDVQARGCLELEFAGYGVMARLLAAEGCREAALQGLYNLREKAAQKKHTVLLQNINACIVRQQLLQSQREPVKMWMETQAPDETARFRTLERYRYHTKALIYLQQKQYGEAQALLQKLVCYFHDYHRPYDEHQALLLSALTLYRQSNKSYEVLLARVLKFCEHYHFLRLVADYGMPVLKMLESTTPQCGLKFYNTLCAETRKQAHLYPQYLSNEESAQALLTDAEREVLRWMAQGMKNSEIADQLYVSLSTVKFHASNIYGKLGAKNRTEAINLALQHPLRKPLLPLPRAPKQ